MNQDNYDDLPSREDVVGPPGWRTASTGSLEGTDRRWIQLESARFVAANTDAMDDGHELATRAHEYAAMKTSTFTPARSAAVCEEFVAKVAGLRKRTYRPRLANVVPPGYEDFDARAIFLC